MGSADKAAAVAKIFGTEATSAALALMDKAADGSLQSYTEQLKEQGSAARVAAEQQNNLAGRIKAMKSASEALKLEAFELMLPLLTSAAEILKKVVLWMRDFANEWPILSSAILIAVGALTALVTVTSIWTTVVGTASAVTGRFDMANGAIHNRSGG